MPDHREAHLVITEINGKMRGSVEFSPVPRPKRDREGREMHPEKIGGIVRRFVLPPDYVDGKIEDLEQMAIAGCFKVWEPPAPSDKKNAPPKEQVIGAAS